MIIINVINTKLNTVLLQLIHIEGAKNGTHFIMIWLGLLKPDF